MLGLTNWTKADKKTIWHPFSPLSGRDPVLVKRAEGVYLHTNDGRKIIDAISSWWVNLHGHGNRKIARAIAAQARNLEQVIFAGFTHKPAISLSKNLLKLLPSNQSKLFFSDDGSTAVEVAMKIAIQYWHNKGMDRKRIIAIEGAYHGDTFGSMSVGSRGVFSLPFFSYLFDVKFIPFPKGDGSNSIDALEEIISGETAAFIFEPLVQGAAGMRMYDPKVLDELIYIVQDKGGLCIADEVMTGFGRTGKTFASDYLKNKPDIICLSKGITGGFLPMGVTAVSEEIVSAFDNSDIEKTFYHGHSYTGNALACAAANASMKLLKDKKTQQAISRINERHQIFLKYFNPPKTVKDVRLRGTILAIELHAEDAGYTSELRDRIYDFFMERDILLRPLGNVLYVMPPYIITDEELDLIYQAIKEFLKEV